MLINTQSTTITIGSSQPRREYIAPTTSQSTARALTSSMSFTSQEPHLMMQKRDGFGHSLAMTTTVWYERQ